MTVTKYTYEAVAPDDHNGPCLLVPEDRPPLLAWSRHGDTDNVSVKRGTVAQTLTSASMEATQTVPFGTETSYAQLFRVSGDDVVLFARYEAGGTSYRWGFRRTDDYADTWAAAPNGGMQPLFIPPVAGHFYFEPTRVGDVLRCGLFQFAVGDIFYLEIDLATGAISRTDGTVVANLDGTNLPYTLTNSERVHHPTSGGCRLLDVGSGPDPELFLVTWTTTLDATYRYMVQEAGVWSAPKAIVAAGQGIGVQTDRYYGGISAPNPSPGGVGFLARESAGSWFLEKAETADGGDTWTRTQRRSSGAPLVRPYCPVGRATGPEVLCHRVIRYAAYDDWNADLHEG